LETRDQGVIEDKSGAILLAIGKPLLTISIQPAAKGLDRFMTYCLGIVTKNGLVMASDSRTNAGYDQVNVTRKMHCFVIPGQ
jgi:hypothetical protein